MSEEFRKYLEFTRKRVKNLLREVEKSLETVEQDVDSDLMQFGGRKAIIALGGEDFYEAKRNSLIALSRKGLKEAREMYFELYSNIDAALSVED